MPMMTDRELRMRCVELAVEVSKTRQNSFDRIEEEARRMYEFCTAEPKGEGIDALISTSDGNTWKWSRDNWQWERVDPAKASD